MEKYFNLLNCNEKTPLKEIEKKYKKIMRKTHPDRGNDDRLCKEINEAYQYILDYKLNNLIDISSTLETFNNEHKSGNEIRKEIEKKIITNELSIKKKKLLSSGIRKFLLENKNAAAMNDIENDTGNSSVVHDIAPDEDTDDKYFGNNEIENTFRKNLLTSRFIYECEEEKQEVGFIGNIINYFF
jgi:DnaJ-class molecular chaperone